MRPFFFRLVNRWDWNKLSILSGAASFTIYNSTKDGLRNRDILTRDRLLDAACLGGLGGAMAGSLISFGSAREFRIFAEDALLTALLVSIRTS